MGNVTKDVRETNRAFALGMYGTGLDLLFLAVLIGGSGFLIQWGIWFILVGAIISGVVRKGADAADWVYSRLPNNPFRSESN